MSSDDTIDRGQVLHVLTYKDKGVFKAGVKCACKVYTKESFVFYAHCVVYNHTHGVYCYPANHSAVVIPKESIKRIKLQYSAMNPRWFLFIGIVAIICGFVFLGMGSQPQVCVAHATKMVKTGNFGPDGEIEARFQVCTANIFADLLPGGIVMLLLGPFLIVWPCLWHFIKTCCGKHYTHVTLEIKSVNGDGGGDGGGGGAIAQLLSLVLFPISVAKSVFSVCNDPVEQADYTVRCVDKVDEKFLAHYMQSASESYYICPPAEAIALALDHADPEKVPLASRT